MSAPLFEIDDLHVRTVPDGTQAASEILRGVSLTVNEGEVHALLGPTGSGKSTLATTLLGSPKYEVTSGRILFRGDNITDWATDVRAKVGLFVAFQNPQEISGVSVLTFLRQALSARKGIEVSVVELRLSLMEWMEKLEIDPSFMERHVNDDCSGGEDKRNEILQMAVLEPEMAVLDETDSDLDSNALRTVAKGVNEVRKERPTLGTLAITRHQRLLDHLQPDVVHVLIDGRVVERGGMEVAQQLETDGYESFR